jgi:hypothetical protein
LIAACHFWSNGVNAFLFGHGPMSPTLADVYMITGLDITGSVHPWDFKGSSRQTGVKPGSGYKNYILNHMKDGPLGEIEYRMFLNMWLCRFIFCGKANKPTLNHIAMATHQWQALPSWEIPSRQCVSYASSNCHPDVHQPKDSMCQWSLVVCSNVAVAAHASDCWC